MKQGFEYSCENYCSKKRIKSYKHGVLNGPSMFYVNDKLEYYYNYKDGILLKRSYRYLYDESGVLKQIRRYDKKGRLKKKIDL